MGKSLWEKFCEFDDRMSEPCFALYWQNSDPELIGEMRQLHEDNRRLRTLVEMLLQRIEPEKRKALPSEIYRLIGNCEV